MARIFVSFVPMCQITRILYVSSVSMCQRLSVEQEILCRCGASKYQQINYQVPFIWVPVKWYKKILDLKKQVTNVPIKIGFKKWVYCQGIKSKNNLFHPVARNMSNRDTFGKTFLSGGK